MLISRQIIFALFIKEQQMAYKNKNIVKEGPFFTHFASLPLRLPHHRQAISQIQQQVRQRLHSDPQFSSPDLLREHNHKLAHLTLFKLILRHNSTRQKLSNLLTQFQQEINSVLLKFPLEITGINYFTRVNKSAKCREITVIYLQIAEHIAQALTTLTDRLIRTLLKQEILATHELKDMNVTYDHNSNLYRPQNLHVSLFRASNLLENQRLLQIMKELRTQWKPLQFQWTSFDISTMKQYDNDEFYLPLIRFSLFNPKLEEQMK